MSPMTAPEQLLSEFIRHASVSTDPGAQVGMEGARAWVAGQLRDLGFAVEEIATPLHPLLLAERRTRPEHPHLLLYGHYDVQPADPYELWTTPPFEAAVRHGRIYGRGAADNKGPMVVHLSALREVLHTNPDLPLNLTYLVEGEEEIGSPSFRGFLEQYRERLAEAEVVLLSDTASPSTEQLVITTALRGLLYVGVKVTGPRTDLHSGMHGGAVRNPIQALATLLASLHTENGAVNVPGFYDEVAPPADWEREELTHVGRSAEDYARFLGVDAFFPPPGYSPEEAIRFAPTLEFNGIGGGFQGEGVKTVIPSEARAKITCRLVADQDPFVLEERVCQALRDRCPPGVTLELETGSRAYPYSVIPPDRPNTPADQPEAVARAFHAVENAVTDTFGRRPLYLREGGSVPLVADLQKIAGLDTILLGLFTPEDNLHAPDESFSLRTLERGIPAFAEIFRRIAGSTD